MGMPSTCATVCGDGFIRGTEKCDDTNTSNLDGCTAACQIEPTFTCTGEPSACTQVGVAETELNDTTIQADANTLTQSSATFFGSIATPTDIDLYRIKVNGQGDTIRFETFSSVNDCNAATTTTLRLYDANFVELYFDTTSGIQGCSALVASLPAGFYYVGVEETGKNATIGTYLLDIAFQSNSGSESENNGTLMTANTTLGNATDAFVLGNRASMDDDYFELTVPAGASIRAEIIEGGAETCESNEVDSTLTLFNAAGTVLAQDTDAGRGACSRIDGTGSTPANAGAKGLAAGSYYLRVTSPSNMSPGLFDYSLQVTVRSP